MADERFVTKYDPHTNRYGVYNRRTKAIAWGDHAGEVKSEVLRRNARAHIEHNLLRAITDIHTTLTGVLTYEERQHFKALREQLRTTYDAHTQHESEANRG